MRRLLASALVTGLAIFAFSGAAVAAGSGGVSGPSFYVDGQLYRTVGTPTDLSNTGGPDSSFDTIYQFFGLQPNVATAAPGDPGYNGGRWRVQGLQFTNYPAAVAAFDTNGSGNFDSAEEVAAALGVSDHGRAFYAYLFTQRCGRCFDCSTASARRRPLDAASAV